MLKVKDQCIAIVGLLIIMISGCAVIKAPERVNNIQLTKDNYRQINGDYSNTAIEDTIPLYNQYNYSLWHEMRVFKNDTVINWKEDTVEIEMLSPNKLKARLRLNNEILKEKTIKGKIKNGYFVSKRKVRLIGIPFVFLVYGNTKFQIGLKSDGNLTVDRSVKKFANVLILFSTESRRYSVSYWKKTPFVKNPETPPSPQ